MTPDKFDYAFLKFESGKVGNAALARLAQSDDPVIAREARRMQQRSAPEPSVIEPSADLTPVVEVWPRGSSLPDGFIGPVPQSDARHMCADAESCVATARPKC